MRWRDLDGRAIGSCRSWPTSTGGWAGRDERAKDGETIRPVQVDGDRRGYVIAVGATNLEAVERAEAAARLLDVEVR